MKKQGFLGQKLSTILIFSFLLLFGCKAEKNNEMDQAALPSFTAFQADIDFLKKHTDLVVLAEPSGKGMIAVSATLQGRVMTSSAAGLEGRSYGWINRALFESGDTLDHMNPFGGEERFWLGPEGGQYAIFFKKGAPFDLDNWQTPRLIDLDAYEQVEKTAQKVVYRKKATLTNYSNFTFDLAIERTIEVLSVAAVFQSLGLAEKEGLKVVGYRTTNTISNQGQEDWKKETGLLSIWLLGMFNPSDATTIVIPFEEGEDAQLGPVVNDTYFGKVPSDRLKVGKGVLFFSGDGKYRSKIGLSPARAKNVAGSYDAKSQILTIVTYNKPDGESEYVNSLWEIQDEPYQGDVINAYNDGPPAPGKKPMGPFYELETSSPALALKVGESGTHIQQTFHFEGAEAALNEMAIQLLGVSLAEITAN
ncbi:MAG: DUF6786 family protein [Saprospiraceae bacterium]